MRWKEGQKLSKLLLCENEIDENNHDTVPFVRHPCMNAPLLTKMDIFGRSGRGALWKISFFVPSETWSRYLASRVWVVVPWRSKLDTLIMCHCSLSVVRHP